MPADSISNNKIVTYKMILTQFILFFSRQVSLCFQRVAAEILGIKLNKAEIEQSQVRIKIKSCTCVFYFYLPSFL